MWFLPVFVRKWSSWHTYLHRHADFCFIWPKKYTLYVNSFSGSLCCWIVKLSVRPEILLVFIRHVIWYIQHWADHQYKSNFVLDYRASVGASLTTHVGERKNSVAAGPRCYNVISPYVWLQPYYQLPRPFLSLHFTSWLLDMPVIHSANSILVTWSVDPMITTISVWLLQ